MHTNGFLPDSSERQSFKELFSLRNLEQTYNKFCKFEENFNKIGKKLSPIIPFKSKKQKPSTTTYDRLLASWSIANYSIAPLVLASPNSTTPELVVKTAACGLSLITGYGLPFLAISELLTNKMPESIKKHKLSRLTTAYYQKQAEKVISFIHAKQLECTNSMKKAGLGSQEIQLVNMVCGQFAIVSVFQIIDRNNMGVFASLMHPFTAHSFIQYAGTLMDHYGIASAENFQNKTSALDLIPLQVINGVALAAIEYFLPVETHASFRLIENTLMMPFVSDIIVNNDRYQNYIVRPAKAMIPYFNKARKRILGYNILNKAVSYIPDSKFIGPLRYAKYLPTAVKVVGGVMAIKKAHKIYNHPLTAKTMVCAKECLKIYGIYYQSSIISTYTGAEIGSLANVAALPKDHFLPPVMIAAFAAAYFTQSPLLASISAYGMQKFIENKRVRSAVDKPLQLIKKAAVDEVKDVLFGPADTIRSVSIAIGTGVACTTNNIAMGYAAMQTTDKLARQSENILSNAKQIANTGKNIFKNITDQPAARKVGGFLLQTALNLVIETNNAFNFFLGTGTHMQPNY